jgi:hypothetical protein
VRLVSNVPRNSVPSGQAGKLIGWLTERAAKSPPSTVPINSRKMSSSTKNDTVVAERVIDRDQVL